MTFTLKNKSLDIIIANNVRIANNIVTRMVGLLRTKSMEIDDALVIKPCNNIHTIGMKFNIDVLFIDKHNRIVKIVRNLSPFNFTYSFKAKYCIELPTNSRIKQKMIGDEIELIPNSN